MRGLHAPSQVLAAFNAKNPEFITETGIARVWKVQCQHGLAALKVYHNPDMGGEANGFRFLHDLQSAAAAKTYQTSGNVALIEWLDGPSLGDLTRQGEDKKACFELADVANKIHIKTGDTALKLPALEEWFAALFDLKVAPQCAADARQNIIYCQRLASELLSSQTDIGPLHGDLHHDNIRLGTRGYCCFDAKGVLGERAYELANAFRNPKGAEQIVQDPVRINMLLDMWSVAFAVERHRLLQWATVKSALSISWRSKGLLKDDNEMALLAVFVGMLKAL